MRILAVLLSLAFAAASRGSDTVGIFVDFEKPPSTAAVAAMEAELKVLLAPAGIAPQWRQLRQNTGKEGFDGVLIVRFKGTCQAGFISAGGIRELFEEEVRLASAKVFSGRVAPQAEVECDNIRKVLARVPLRDRANMLGSVLGRVVAHELYHLLLQKIDHARSGLAKAVVDWNELLGKRAGFAHGEIVQLAHHRVD